jgi:hypothetical protein
MRARIIDPRRPLWMRGAAVIVPALLVGLGAWTELVPFQVVALSGALFYLMATLLWRRPPREAEIAVGPGFVDIKRAGLRSERIRGRDVKGASAAFLARGIGLSLQHRGRPIALELREDRDADAVRDALGIGHHGFGKIGWKLTANKAVTLGQWVCIALTFICVYGANEGDPAVAALLLIVAAPLITLLLGSMALASWMSARSGSRPIGVELEARGVILLYPRCEIPYGVIIDASVTDYGMVIRTEPQYNWQSIRVYTNGHMAVEERTHCVAQMIAGARRARGLGPRERLVSGQVEDLARGQGDARAWLLRLDAAAQQMTSGAGYRSVAVDTAELWAALENHEADEHVRAAAARVLVRTDKESKKRIQTIAESTRDKITERRIRVVLEPDIDEAGRELDELDQRRRMTLDAPGSPEGAAPVGARRDLR